MYIKYTDKCLQYCKVLLYVHMIEIYSIEL